MVSVKSLLFGKKAVPFVDVLSEATRDGINKAYIPKFLYKPPFGYPRYANMSYIRYLAKTPYVEMCIDTILKELCSVPWDIIPNPDIPKDIFLDSKGDFSDQTKIEIAHQKNFLLNPNTNPNEYFEDVCIKMPIRDVLEINTGVINKVFNFTRQMVELVSRDGATFTKNPDIHGMMTARADLILQKEILKDLHEVINPFQHIAAPIVREQGAYFQYGWIAGPVPVPFGKREIVWMQNMIRSDDIYGYSAIQLLAKNLQMLLYQIESDVEYYNENNVPKGIIGIDASDADEIKGFKEQWYEQSRRKDEFGNWKRMMNKVPILNYIPHFERIEFSSSEIQLIEKQKWYTKMVWACFGVTPTELGYTEDAQGTANQIVQSKVFRKKSINPLLKMIENSQNNEILPEFEYTWDLKIGKSTLVLPKYMFKFKVFDIDEEKSKVELFEKQIDNGIKTVNEIRKTEGDEPVEWGDERPQKFREQASQFNFGEESYSNREKEARKQAEKPTSVPTTKEPQKNKEKVEKQLENQKAKPEDKAGTSSSPLILKEGEKPTEKHLKKAIDYVLKQNEKLIKDLVVKEHRQSVLTQIKSMNDPAMNEPDGTGPHGRGNGPGEGRADGSGMQTINENDVEIKALPELIEKFKSLLDFSGLEGIAYAVIKAEFLSGAEKSEEGINKVKAFNYVPDTDAISYISDYTFENIKGMTDDVADKLRGELQRSFMNGEGIEQIKSRITGVFNVGENRAEMIARTETTRAHAFGKLSAYRQSEIKAVKWLLWTDDDRTSAISKALHSKYGTPEQAIPLDAHFKATVKIGKKTVIIDQDAPPFHVNERDELMIEPELLHTLEREKKHSKLANETLDFILKKKELALLNSKEQLISKLESEMNG